MLSALGFGEKATLAFVMAAGFVADTSSLPLIWSNLVNIFSADFFGIGFDRCALVMVPVDLAAIAATLAVLMLWFRRDIPVVRCEPTEASERGHRRPADLRGMGRPRAAARRLLRTGLGQARV